MYVCGIQAYGAQWFGQHLGVEMSIADSAHYTVGRVVIRVLLDTLGAERKPP